MHRNQIFLEVSLIERMCECERRDRSFTLLYILE